MASLFNDRVNTNHGGGCSSKVGRDILGALIPKAQRGECYDRLCNGVPQENISSTTLFCWNPFHFGAK